MLCIKPAEAYGVDAWKTQACVYDMYRTSKSVRISCVKTQARVYVMY